jgi:hypothetical protein
MVVRIRKVGWDHVAALVWPHVGATRCTRWDGDRGGTTTICSGYQRRCTTSREYTDPNPVATAIVV